MSESFSGRLRHLREKKNLTQNELAKATGIPRSTIASWEAGKWLQNGQKQKAHYHGFLLTSGQKFRLVSPNFSPLLCKD